MLPEPLACVTGGCESWTPPEEVARNGCPRDTWSDTTLGETMRDFMAITKALADENRVRMLLALRRQKLCVCQIVEFMQLATSTVSKHMSILKLARLVESRKEGRWMYYRLPGGEAPAAVRKAIKWVFTSVAKDPQALRDRQRLEEICKVDPHELCVAQETTECGRRR